MKWIPSILHEWFHEFPSLPDSFQLNSRNNYSKSRFLTSSIWGRTNCDWRLEPFWNSLRPTMVYRSEWTLIWLGNWLRWLACFIWDFSCWWIWPLQHFWTISGLIPWGWARQFPWNLFRSNRFFSWRFQEVIIIRVNSCFCFSSFSLRLNWPSLTLSSFIHQPLQNVGILWGT